MKNVDFQELKVSPVISGISILSARDAYNFLLSVWDEDICLQESVFVLFLTNEKQLIDFKQLFKGGRAVCNIDNSVILRNAILLQADSIILAHNHPSGSIKPSPGDDNTTFMLNFSAYTIGVTLIDHLIISPVDFYSYADKKGIEKYPAVVTKAEYESLRGKYNNAILKYYRATEDINRLLKEKL